MRFFTYDFEVSAYDWLVVIKDSLTQKYIIIHNDPDAFKEVIDNYPDEIFVGFNSKSYDRFIAQAIYAGFPPEKVKQVNDWIIQGNQGWDCPLLKGHYFKFNNVDIRDDMQQTMSLKSIEGHLGMDIEETEVDFNLDRPWTPDELSMMIHYCKHDVDATEEIVKIRSDYLLTKRNLGERAGISDADSLACTNAKLTAKMLHAQRREWNDGRDYVYPPNLAVDEIPKEILDFFEQIHDKNLTDEEVFSRSLDIEIAGMPCRYAWGGAHGSLTGYFEEETEDRCIRNTDVSSLYPSLIELYNYLSRNVPDPQLFYQMRKDRIKAKHDGHKPLANDLKLPLNTVSGAQESQYNDLYDPLPTRSMRISGQLFTTVLLIRLVRQCKTIKLLNYNTDGVAYSIDRSEVSLADRIQKEWEAETRFELETDEISRIWIKDVNNLLIVKTDGTVKTVGAYLNYGVQVKGAWSINNNAIIVKKALIDYFVNGTPVEQTINDSTNILEFQYIAKAGSKYSRAFTIFNGMEVDVQNVNRVYAIADERYGTLYKVKKENGQIAKIENLPDHCVIDNKNQLSIDVVDKQFYIDMAKKRVNDFLGIKPEKKGRSKKVATATKMNVYQKLIEARARFVESNPSKSGKNMHLSFMYFELEDIVPTAIKIFRDLGLLPVVSFTTPNGENMPGLATMSIVNTDDPKEAVVFEAPFNQIQPILSKEGKQATNEMQALGSSITYMRRYLYMIALDIVEADSIDSSAGSAPVKTQPPKAAPKAPATPAERKEIKKVLTNTDAPVTKIMLKGLVTKLNELSEKNPDAVQQINDSLVNSGKTLKDLTKSEAESLMTLITQALGDKENEGN